PCQSARRAVNQHPTTSRAPSKGPKAALIHICYGPFSIIDGNIFATTMPAKHRTAGQILRFEYFELVLLTSPKLGSCCAGESESA
ncbi:MAG TPA: hypothetical protein DEF45_27205, partial [Rhodopirellula sp.]|nr:hypothetical protein [Rhodopirellula sp.]